MPTRSWRTASTTAAVGFCPCPRPPTGSQVATVARSMETRGALWLESSRSYRCNCRAGSSPACAAAAAFRCRGVVYKSPGASFIQGIVKPYWQRPILRYHNPDMTIPIQSFPLPCLLWDGGIGVWLLCYLIRMRCNRISPSGPEDDILQTASSRLKGE